MKKSLKEKFNKLKLWENIILSFSGVVLFLVLALILTIFPSSKIVFKDFFLKSFLLNYLVLFLFFMFVMFFKSFFKKYFYKTHQNVIFILSVLFLLNFGDSFELNYVVVLFLYTFVLSILIYSLIYLKCENIFERISISLILFISYCALFISQFRYLILINNCNLSNIDPFISENNWVIWLIAGIGIIGFILQFLEKDFFDKIKDGLHNFSIKFKDNFNQFKEWVCNNYNLINAIIVILLGILYLLISKFIFLILFLLFCLVFFFKHYIFIVNRLFNLLDKNLYFGIVFSVVITPLILFLGDILKNIFYLVFINDIFNIDLFIRFWCYLLATYLFFIILLFKFNNKNKDDELKIK